MSRLAHAFRVWLAVAAPALGVAGCASWTTPYPAGHCGPPDFPYSEGWLGGDAAYSIPIDARTSLWLFGDSFVVSQANSDTPATRQGAVLVHNSIAISTCTRSGEWSFDYTWGSDENGEPTAFLDPGLTDGYWWLFDGFVHREKLYIGLLSVMPSDPRGALNLPFRFDGVKLARIANFRAPPEQWRVDVLPLSSDSGALPSSAFVIEGDHLYLFAFLDLASGRSPRILTRLPLDALEAGHPADQLEYLARSGEWKAGLDARDARVLMSDDASEMSVNFHRSIGRWLAVYSYPSAGDATGPDAPSDRIYLRSARRLEGPWSEPHAIYTVPELAADASPGRDPNTFCYAAKEHPQLAHREQLVITYVCNLFTRDGEDPFAVLRRLFDNMYLYRPRAVTLPLPEIEAH